MSLTFISILLFIGGIIAGIVAMFVINNIKKSNKDNQADKILKNAYKDAEKIKNDALVSGREEAKQNKIDVEKLLVLLEAIKPSDVKEVVDKYDLDLDYLEVFDLLSNLYDALYENC